MTDDEFFERTRHIVDDRMILSLTAQVRGTKFFDQVMHSIEQYVDYRPAFSSRIGKSRNRILNKARKLHVINPELSPEAVAVETTDDLAAGRLLVIGLADILLAHKWCCEEIRGHPSIIRLLGEPKQYLQSAKDTGFRGLIQKTELVLDNGPFPFELQIMTYLQHTWDQLQHKLYEILRLGPDMQGEGVQALNDRFRQLSETLYSSDLEMDTIRHAMSGATGVAAKGSDV